MEDTVFMKIARRELPAEILYEDEETLAFLDQMPDCPGHTLIIPKKPVRNIFDADEATFARVMRTAHALAPKIRDAVGASGIQVRINNEPSAGQAVFHLHIHLVPFLDSNPARFPPKEKEAPEELAKIGAKIRAAISA